MHCLLIATILLLAMPIKGSGWAEGSNVLLDPTLVCKKTHRLNSKLSGICNDTSLMSGIRDGISMGFIECQYQFKYRKWNCTAIGKSMKKILVKDTRETGFVNAITAAGITYSITRACRLGELTKCSCDTNHGRRNNNNYNENKKKRKEIDENLIINNSNLNSNNNYNNDNNNLNNNKRNNQNKNDINNINNKNINNKKHNRMRKYGKQIVYPEGDWEWGGCGDNINYGFKKSKDFLDARYKKRSDIKTLIKLHNSNAGRLAVRNYMRLECKCHGLSGSCTVKTCWLKMPLFREVGIRLKDRFDGAVKVIASNDGNSFMPEGSTIKPPTRQDLIYTEMSSDFCEPDYKLGSIGTYGRECNSTSPGDDGCELLCCGRGYDHKIIKEKIECNCKFIWCCNVVCSTCIEKREMNTCKNYLKKNYTIN